MSTLVRPDGFVMQNVSWTSYTQLADEIETGGTRIIYDQGQFEIMTTSAQHEQVKKITARLLETWAYENDWPVTGWGNVTLRRRDLRVGLEADECYFIETPVPPATPGEFDLMTYPPPDLAIEVEITRSAIDKISIYARLGVPEIWRWTGEQFIVLHRQDDGQYAIRDASRFLPDLPMADLGELVRLALRTDQLTAVRTLRDRFRKN